MLFMMFSPSSFRVGFKALHYFGMHAERQRIVLPAVVRDIGICGIANREVQRPGIARLRAGIWQRNADAVARRCETRIRDPRNSISA